VSACSQLITYHIVFEICSTLVMA